MTQNKQSNQAIATAISLVIILLVIGAGPAQAITLNLGTFIKDNLVKGESTSILANISIRSDERISLQNITLKIEKSNFSQSCIFNPNGTSISGCDDLSITLLNNSTIYGYGYGYQYGYGYGYGYNEGYSQGTLSYNITINTGNFNPGNYKLILFTNLSTQSYESSYKYFNVTEQSTTSSTTSTGSTNSYEFGGTINDQTNPPNNGNNENNNNPTEEPNETLNTNEGTSRITGAVIGALGSNGTILIIFMIVIIAGLITVRYMRVRQTPLYENQLH